MWSAVLPVLGFLIGIVAAMTGVGGGVFIVPILTLLYSFSPATAVGTSLAAIVLTSTAATANYSFQKRIRIKIGLLLSITTAPGALLGAYLTSITPSRVLGLVFGGFLLIVAFRMAIENPWRKREQKERKKFENGKPSNNSWSSQNSRLIVGVALSFFGGFTSGLLGVGGGIILVPIMTFVIGMTIHSSIATSMFVIMITSIFGVGQHYSLGNINLQYAMLIGLGSVIGAQIGAFTSRKISGKNLRRIFGLLLLLASIQMIIKFV
jgi:uncharacterized membrane protein YfcA